MTHVVHPRGSRHSGRSPGGMGGRADRGIDRDCLASDVAARRLYDHDSAGVTRRGPFWGANTKASLAIRATVLDS